MINYSSGTLLFNICRSGYNVKKFVSNDFNILLSRAGCVHKTSAWVSEVVEWGMVYLYTGRKAQRNMVVKALRSVLDTNTAIRDDDNFFNLMVLTVWSYSP